MWQTEFKNPYYLFLLIPYGIMVFWYFYRQFHRRRSAFGISSASLVKVRRSFRVRTYPYVVILRFVAILCLIIAVARPGRGIHYSTVKNLGIDIMVALDVSGSMMGEDFQPKNRLAVAKEVVKDFIDRRTSDRIGMVVFAGDSYLQCPLTSEHDMIKDLVDEVDFNMVTEQGTAIGDAISLSASRMMESKAKSKIILLITDGVSNQGRIDPGTATEACRELGIKIYSVGIGKNGKVPYPGGPFGSQWINNQFDPTVLEDASKKTGGRFYRATSSGVLWENIRDIDMLEKSEVDLKIYHEFHDKFQIFLVIAMAAFFLEIILRSLYYRKVP